MKHSSLALIFTAILFSGCESAPERPSGQNNSNNNNTSVHQARCEAACALESGNPCQADSQQKCITNCKLVVQGSNAACAQCIVEKSGYTGRKCSCYGMGCQLETFSPGDRVGNPAGPDDTCSQEQEVCWGNSWADASKDCKSLCFGEDVTEAPVAALKAQCAARCATDREPCASKGDQASCKSQCEARIDGLKPACAACMVSRGAWKGKRCSCYGMGCNLGSFGKGPTSGNTPSPEDSCSAEEEVCSEYEWPSLTDDCTELCS